MNFKNIIKFFFLFILLFQYSCKTPDLFEKDNTFSTIKKFNLEKSIEIKNSEYISTNQYQDHYILKKNNKWISKKEIQKLGTIKNYSKKNSFNNPINLIIDENFIYSFKDNTSIKVYNKNDFKFINEIKLQHIFKNKISSLSSIAFSNDLFYSAYSTGEVITFDLNGNIIWIFENNDILKTPIKIFNDNIILLYTNKIVALNSENGQINWEYIYENNSDSLEVLGGDIININHLLYFILPNGRIGEIDTILGEKNYSVFSKIKFDESFDKFEDSIFSYNKNIYYINGNKYLSNANINTDQILNNEIIIDNLKSFNFLNNALLILDDNNSLNVYNSLNTNIFWQNDLSEIILKDDLIINSIKSLNSVIIFFKSGYIIEFDDVTGEIIFTQKIRTPGINYVYFIDDYILLSQINDKTIIYSQ